MKQSSWVIETVANLEILHFYAKRRECITGEAYYFFPLHNNRRVVLEI